jgi:hypothetical protein
MPDDLRRPILQPSDGGLRGFRPPPFLFILVGSLVATFDDRRPWAVI